MFVFTHNGDDLFHLKFKDVWLQFLDYNCKPGDFRNIRNNFVRQVVQALCYISYEYLKDSYRLQFYRIILAFE